MLATRSWQGLLAIIALALLGAESRAQSVNYNPASPLPNSAGGAAGRQLANIRASSVGFGYSGSAMNNISLASARANIPYSTGYNPADISTVNYSSPGLNIGSSPTNKPFSNISPSPTLSPYLGLFNETLSDNVLPNYNAFVQPRLQQQQVNQTMQRQTQSLNRQVQSMNARPAFDPRGSQTIMPTGHPATFFYYSNYYPANSRRR